jgi:hypothetical protein
MTIFIISYNIDISINDHRRHGSEAEEIDRNGGADWRI